MMWGIDPWRELERVRREMENLFSQSDYAAPGRNFPLVNMYESADDLVVTAELPGMSKDDVNITYADGLLVLSGERKPQEKTTSMAAVRRERAEGPFEKSVRVPVKVKAEGIAARFRDGVLTITFPKAEEVKPKKVAVQVG